jgi:diadenosine tetraphosphate (Ap4A) HIT family hydrolase
MLLMNDSRYPWLILVPRRVAITEIHHLPAKEQQYLYTEITKTAEFLEEEFQLTKINIGALGNIVPQLHIHIVGRTSSDPAWPNPVWGHSPQVPYQKRESHKIIKKIITNFTE